MVNETINYLKLIDYCYVIFGFFQNFTIYEWCFVNVLISFFNEMIYFNWRIITLHYCDYFCHQVQVQSLSHVWLFVTSLDLIAHQASLSITNSRSLFKLMSIASGDAIQPSHPLSSPSPPTFNLSQHQSLFKWVSSSYQVYKAVVLSMVTLVFSVVSLVQKVLSRFAFFNLYYKSRRCRIFSSKH